MAGWRRRDARRRLLQHRPPPRRSGERVPGIQEPPERVRHNSEWTRSARSERRNRIRGERMDRGLTAVSRQTEV